MGDTPESCYAKTISIINEAESYIEERIEDQNLFGGRKSEALPEAERRAVAAVVMPLIRGAVSDERKMILTFDDAEDVLRFVGGADSEKLSGVGAACPDHLVHTKMKPLLLRGSQILMISMA